MSQMKEQNKAPEKELNKMETSNIPAAEFDTVVIRMLNKLRGKADELSENFNEETKITKKNRDRKHKKEPNINDEYNN